MPRNRPSAAARDRRALLAAAERLVDAAAVSLPEALAALERIAAGAAPAQFDLREEPLAEYRPVSQLSLAHLGRWVAVLGGTYQASADPTTEREARFAATYGALGGLAGLQAQGGRLVGFAPSSKAAPAGESLGYRVVVIQKGSLTSSLEVWAGRPVFIAPRELS